MKKLLPALLASAVIAGMASTSAVAEPQNPPQKAVPYTGERPPERGVFFYERPPEEEVPPVEEPAMPHKKQPTPEPEKKPVNKCVQAKTWTPDCGFIDPKEDFDFQAKQRDALLKQMVTKENDPQAVEAFQRYIKWVMGRASQVANLWHYNMVQNPELDPNVTEPVSAFGLQLASKVKSANDSSMMGVIAEEGQLVYFTRKDCTYCYQMAPSVIELAKANKLKISVVSFDKHCLPGFAECITGDLATQTGGILQVGVVPALFLHIKPQTWLRIANGVVDQQTMHDRIIQFFTAYRHALLKGVKNGNNLKPAQDGSYTWSPDGTAEGVPLPSQTDVESLLKSPTGQ